MGVKERGGYIRAQAIPNTGMDALAEVVRRNVKRGSIVSLLMNLTDTLY
jgi:hypothetical protein